MRQHFINVRGEHHPDTKTAVVKSMLSENVHNFFNTRLEL